MIANCPARISNVGGAYSFSCPAGWTYINCDQLPTIEHRVQAKGVSAYNLSSGLETALPYTILLDVWPN